MRSLRTIVYVLVMLLVLAGCVPSPAATPGSGPAPAGPTTGAATALPTAGASKASPAAPTAAAPTAAVTSVAGSSTPTTKGQEGPVKVGSKDFTEELLLGEMYALVLEANGVQVQRKLNLAGTQVAHEALVRGEIDVYPEYTGTGYLFILGIKDNDKDPARVYQRVADNYKQKWSLVWLDRSPMNDTNAIACTKQAVQQNNLKTLSDLSKAASNLSFAAIPDFEQRPDGLKGLRELYGGFQFKSLTVFDPGLKYKAVSDGKAQCVIAFSTDAQIRELDLVLIEDDKGLWPPYNVAPVIREAALAKYPQARDALNKLSPLITTEVITGLNYKVDVQKQEYAAVAKEFLQSQSLIK